MKSLKASLLIDAFRKRPSANSWLNVSVEFDLEQKIAEELDPDSLQ